MILINSNGLLKRIEVIKSYQIKFYCSKVEAKRWSKTVFVPKCDLPSRQPPSFEKTLLKRPCFSNLYEIQAQRRSEQQFILHDGPPYANGSLHFGHVINKTLKDIICRYKLRKGCKVNFIPGWDCHGLPIESKVLKNSKEASALKPLDLRKKAREQASLAIKEQMESFKRLGISADWSSPYATYSNQFVINELEAFKQLYSKGLINRNFLPIYFSPSNKTTLAESELEYNSNHVSPSIFFQFKVNHELPNLEKKNIYALIWTTTPWTLPGNQAIAFSSDITYVVAFAPNLSRHFIIAQEAIPDLQEKLATPLITKITIKPDDFSKLSYTHPMRPNEQLPFLAANYVTISKGTGLVHCAPNHGREDFSLGKANNLPINNCLVNDSGNFVSGLHSTLDGRPVLEEGSNLVMNLLSEDIVFKEDYVHSYPYDWRSQKPVLIKTSQQWFIDIDKVRADCLKELNEVDFFPKGVQNKIKDELNERPPWCISRQRTWGVPIPVFYHKDDVDKAQPLVSLNSIDFLKNIVSSQSIDVWWNQPASSLVSPKFSQEFGISGDNIVTGKDIFDVWFDSGLTWNSVLPGEKISDIYLEGIDQCHGWFQTSLILSVALRGKAPYKSVYVHGFAVDGEGRKMSKSLGNVVDPLPLLESRYGADTIRLFVAKHGSHHGNVKVDTEQLKSSSEFLLKIRNTLKFCLGSLSDFGCNYEFSYRDLNFISKYMLHQLRCYYQTCIDSFEKNDFRSVIYESHSFIEDFSSFYLKVTKDSLYCDALDSHDRRTCQMIIYYFIEVLNNFLSPVVPFLFEEFNQARLKDENAPSCFLKDWFECPETWEDNQVSLAMGTLRRIKEAIDSQTDDVKHFGKPYEGHIICHREYDLETFKTIQMLFKRSLDKDFANILQLSHIELTGPVDQDSFDFDTKIIAEGDFPFTIFLKKTQLSACPRCRWHLSKIENNLCHRCNLVVHSLPNSNS